MEVFELSETQTNYILEMPLRRLTRFSRIELETERDKLEATIAELTEILENPEQLQHPRRQPARRDRPAARHAAPDDPARRQRRRGHRCDCSAGGRGRSLLGAALLRRSARSYQPRAAITSGGSPGPTMIVIVSKIISTARGDCGLITSAGRLIKISALDLPTVPTTAHAPNLQGGTHVSELVTLGADEKVLCLTTLTDDSLGLALGTARGVVKRVNPEVLGKDSWDVIRLEPGDRVVGAVELTTTRGRARLHHQRRPAAALSRRQPYDRRAAREAAWPASNSASARVSSTSGQ